jgi:hypothetical protein
LGPGSAAVESLGCSAGPPVRGRRRGQLCGSHCLSAVTAWGAPARSWQVPSESVGVGVIARSRGWEQLPPLGTPTAAGGGRLNLASSRTIQYRFPPPLGGLEAAIPGGGVRAIARASGRPGGPAAAPPPESAGWRASGPEEWRRAYVGSWIDGCRRPFPGDCVQSSPRSAASPLRSRRFDSSVGVRVGLLIPKATG